MATVVDVKMQLEIVDVEPSGWVTIRLSDKMHTSTLGADNKDEGPDELIRICRGQTFELSRKSTIRGGVHGV